MGKTFRSWDVDQAWPFPPSVKDLVPPDHLAHYVRDLVREELDLSDILETCDEARGFRQFLLRGMERVREEWSLQGVSTSLRPR